MGTALAALGLVAYWALVLSEGVYLGPRVVTWLYDRVAPRYDRIKNGDPDDDARWLARPLLLALDGVARPRVLDVGTGSGRMLLALAAEADFDGQAVGVDRSAGMLGEARRKVGIEPPAGLGAGGGLASGHPQEAGCQEPPAGLAARCGLASGHSQEAGCQEPPAGLAARCGLASNRPREVGLARADAGRLPFPDAGFDAVTCLEALEFTRQPAETLREMARTLKPGGVLLVSNRVGWDALAYPGRLCGRGRLERALRRMGLEVVESERWQVYYDLVWARRTA